MPATPAAPSFRLLPRTAIHHLFPQEIQLPDANATVIPTPPREPLVRPQEPGPKGENPHNPQRDRGVVEVLTDHGVDGRQTEGHRDEGHP